MGVIPIYCTMHHTRCIMKTHYQKATELIRPRYIIFRFADLTNLFHTVTHLVLLKIMHIDKRLIVNVVICRCFIPFQHLYWTHPLLFCIYFVEVGNLMKITWRVVSWWSLMYNEVYRLDDEHLGFPLLNVGWTTLPTWNHDIVLCWHNCPL